MKSEDLVGLAFRALMRGCRRFLERFELKPALARVAEKIAVLFRSKVPRCSTCGKQVEHYVVMHELGDCELRVVATCHGMTRVRTVHAKDARGRDLFRMADWLRNDPFPLEPSA